MVGHLSSSQARSRAQFPPADHRGRRTHAHLCSQEHFFALRTAGGKQTTAQGAAAGCACAACAPASKIEVITSPVSFIIELLQRIGPAGPRVIMLKT
jgi:hypothetical protein